MTVVNPLVSVTPFLFSLFTPPPPPPPHSGVFFFCPSVSVGRQEKDRGQEEREQEMEDTGDDNVEDPREWSSGNVATFVRSLGFELKSFNSHL